MTTIKLIIKLKNLLPLLLFITTPFSFAGTSDGGGGVGVRCPSSSSTTAFELLDLHEVKLKGESIAESPATIEEAIVLSAYKLGTHYYISSIKPPSWYIDYLKKNIIEKIFHGKTFTNPINGSLVNIEYVEDLELSNDIGDYQIKEGCSLEQVAYYFDQTNTLKIVTTRWNELSWVGRSALVSHEIQYFLDRYNSLEDFGSSVKKTSMRVRNFIGTLYSKRGVEPKYKDIPATGDFSCATNVDSPHRNTQFSIFTTGSNDFTAVFESIQGYSSAYATKTVFTKNPLTNITDWFDGEMSSTEQLSIATTETTPNFSIKITKNQYENPKLQAFTEKKGVKIPLGPEEEILCWDPN